jgi:hypothetical protein
VVIVVDLREANTDDVVPLRIYHTGDDVGSEVEVTMTAT